MNTLPLFFNLNDKHVLIIGGGDVAQRKASLLADAGASLVVLAERFDDKFEQFLFKGQHVMIHKTYASTDLRALKEQYGLAFVICATDNQPLNEQVHHDTKQLGLLINVVDNPSLCDFIFPAIVNRDPITIGVSSNGNAPVLARLIRAKIESVLPSDVGNIAKRAGEFRQTVKHRLDSITKRRHFWENVFERALNDQPIGSLDDELEGFMSQGELTTGEVYIVGTGAGNPDLLTFKALRLMQQADVVLYDALVSPQILALCRRDSDKVFVGKKRANHTKTQAQINELLVSLAKQGRRVLRLKGGDPFVFGRGGEEMLACRQAGVPYQVVAGITSALAAATAAGIPLTHRGVATSVRFLTACYQTDTYFDGLKSVYHPDETLVFYMGLHALDKVVDTLIAGGLDSHTKIAIIANASLENQQILTATLGDVVQKQHIAQLPAPAILIVGEVVGLHVGESGDYHDKMTCTKQQDA